MRQRSHLRVGSAPTHPGRRPDKGAGAGEAEHLPGARAGKHRRPRHIPRPLVVGGAVALAAVAIFADAYLQALGMAGKLEALSPQLEAARAELLANPGGAEPAMDSVIGEAEALQAEADRARFTFRLVGEIPFVDRPIEAVRHGVASAYEATRALDIVREVMAAALGPGAGSAKKGADASALVRDGVVNVDLLRSLTPRVEAAVRHLEAADAHVRAIPHIPFVDRLDALKTKALAQSEKAQTLARRALSGLRVLPGFLGVDGPKTYFLALQNNADQRATGGTLLAYGLIRIDRGHIDLRAGGSIYDIDRRSGGIPVELPKPVRWYLRATERAPRLAQGINYTPDFPVVAETWARQVEKRGGIDLDGVIAMDPVGVSYLLRGQPPIRVASYTKRITAKNVVFVVENDQYRLPGPQQQALPSELIEKAFGILTDPRDVFGTARNLGEALAEKHIQMWSANPKEQSLFGEVGWDGALERSPGDYLFVTRSKRNVGKQDFYAHQSIEYTVEVQPSGDATATTSIRLESRMPPGLPGTITGNWEPYGLNVAMFNVYVPKQAADPVVRPAGEVGPPPEGFVQHVEGDWRVYTKTIEAWRGHPGTVSFRYRIPGVVRSTREGRVYELLVQHQPMVPPARIRIAVKLPPGASVKDVDPGWEIKGGRATFEGLLKRALRLKLVF